MTVIMSVFLAVVQGIAEFLPISSSGHLSIFQNLLGMASAEEGHMFFDVMLHFGTLCSVVFFYRDDLKSMVIETLEFVSGRAGNRREDGGRFTPSVRTTFLVIIGTLPLFIMVPFNDRIESLYYNTTFIGFALIVTGGLLYASNKLSEGRKSAKTATILDALIVGLAQMIALVPGLSRSGTTISVCLARGFSREFAVRFSFLLSVPAVLGSFILTLFKALREGIVWAEVPVYLLGMVIAAVVGYFALSLVKYLSEKAKLGRFAYYCWAVGLIAIILSIVL